MSSLQNDRPLLHQIWVRKRSVAVIAAVAAASAMYFSLQQPPVYAAESRLLVRGFGGGSPNMATEHELVRSLDVALVVQGRLGLHLPVRELLEDLSIETPSGSEIIVLTFTYRNREIAREVSEGFAQAYLVARRKEAGKAQLEAAQLVQEKIDLLSARLDDVDEQLQRTATASEVVITSLLSRANILTGLLAQERADLLTLQSPPDVGELLQPAVVLGRVGPTRARNVLLGLVLGLMLGVAQAALRGRLDDRLSSTGEAESIMGSAALAMIPSFPRLEKRLSGLTLLTFFSGLPRPISDAFAALRVSFLAASSRRHATVVLVTSASTGDGGTSIAALLGVSLARTGKSVTLVCADPRRHRLERLFSMRADLGLTQFLQGTVPLNKATVPTAVRNLILLPCGREADRPTELFQLDAMRTTLQSLARGSDFVLVDGPALADADAVALLPIVDAVIFVVDARHMRAPTLLLARRQLDRVKAPIVGLVFNRVTVRARAGRPLGSS